MRDILYKDLTHLYKIALHHKKFEMALKVKKLQAHLMGFLVTKSSKIPKLEDLLDGEIEQFLLESSN